MATRFDPAQFGGIAPKPPTMAPPNPVNTKFPLNPAAGGPVMTPGGGGTGAPISAPSPNFSPAARDIALRNLATQTPAAPTAPQPMPPTPAPPAGGVPAGGPPVAAAPPPAAGTPATDLEQAPQRPDLGSLMDTHRADVQSFMQQMHAATDPAQRRQLIDGFKTQMQSWVSGLRDSLDQFHMQMHNYQQDQRGDRQSEFGNHWDQLDQQDQAAAPQPTGDTSQGQEDANANADAQRIKRARRSRQAGSAGGASGAGIYTGAGG